ncbi:ATP-binding cassette domain-containing protein [Aestuariibius sp. HNIBRBA575]|uniref:ATP-binding cassette domain-containing protein n=1 Tax=Aestuariibius sp. HNIBRBA575 TaxID=3233343 RepID=UPI0034A16A16
MDTHDRFGLTHMADAWAQGLSGGQQKLLTLAMLAISDAPLIILDEPAAGVNPSMINKLVDHVLALNAEGKTIVVVEQNLSFIERVAPRVLVIVAGEKLCEGSMAEIRDTSEVQRAYVGSMAVPVAKRTEVA